MEEELDLQFLRDINLRLTGEVGRTKKNFIDILRLKEGDIIKLDKNIEDYIEIYLRGQLFAIGELVVVNEKYAVRVVDLA
ncbi:MAG TPA: flagellar motor switch protein FliN [Persephonella sp.]|nr:flagellar motor switch protein FliN [Persephonella sp.]